jgi:formyltetrahydrofolate-dependent phosphoribosylglycinamide formyltransferase
MLKRIAVLASGGGSNLAALHDYLRDGAPPEIVLVASDQPRAGALERARSWDIAAVTLSDRGSDASQIERLLQEHAVELIVLAGYLRHVPRSVVAAYRGRIINIHPALLPSFGGAGMYGRRVHAAVIEHGARVSGATVHFVDEEYDRGPIIAQWPVPVLYDDTPEALAARVLHVEHLLLPRAVHAVARGSVHLDDEGRLVCPVSREASVASAFTLHSESDDTIAEAIDRLFLDA